jgi:hypothetical protein
MSGSGAMEGNIRMSLVIGLALLVIGLLPVTVWAACTGL